MAILTAIELAMQSNRPAHVVGYYTRIDEMLKFQKCMEQALSKRENLPDGALDGHGLRQLIESPDIDD